MTDASDRRDEEERREEGETGAAEVVDRTPEPMPDRRVYFPRGWGCALLVLVVVLVWLMVGVLWNPEWWPFWHELRWGVRT
jgi:hypothetical protein